jgi:hypothetical protein
MDTPFIVPVVFFLSLAAVFILRGPLGKALADRVAGRHLQSAERPDGEQLTAELEEMRLRLTELENRVDFAERLLAKGRDADRAAPGR